MNAPVESQSVERTARNVSTESKKYDCSQASHCANPVLEDETIGKLWKAAHVMGTMAVNQPNRAARHTVTAATFILLRCIPSHERNAAAESLAPAFPAPFAAHLIPMRRPSRRFPCIDTVILCLRQRASGLEAKLIAVCPAFDAFGDGP